MGGIKDKIIDITADAATDALSDIVVDTFKKAAKAIDEKFGISKKLRRMQYKAYKSEPDRYARRARFHNKYSSMMQQISVKLLPAIAVCAMLAGAAVGVATGGTLAVIGVAVLKAVAGSVAGALTTAAISSFRLMQAAHKLEKQAVKNGIVKKSSQDAIHRPSKLAVMRTGHVFAFSAKPAASVTGGDSQQQNFGLGTVLG